MAASSALSSSTARTGISLLCARRHQDRSGGPVNNQLSLPGSIEISELKIKPEDSGSALFVAAKSLHAERFHLDVGWHLPVLPKRQGLWPPIEYSPTKTALPGSRPMKLATYVAPNIAFSTFGPWVCW